MTFVVFIGNSDVWAPSNGQTVIVFSLQAKIGVCYPALELVLRYLVSAVHDPQTLP